MTRMHREKTKRAILASWDRVRHSRDRPRAVVLCYHSIHPDRSFASAGPSEFDEQLAWLTDNFRVLPLTPGNLDLARQSAADDAAIVMLTFDDGYEDNYDYAFPALVRRGVQATFFVTTGLVNGDADTMERFRRERRCPPEDLRPMNWAQMREMRDAGMAFGSHTHSHRNLATLDALDAAAELRTSKCVLEQGLGAPVTMLAYPYGKPRVHFSRTHTFPLVRGAGYEVAAAVLARALRQDDSSLAVPRFIATRDDIGDLDAKIRGTYDVIGSWQEHAPVRLQRLVSPADFTH